MSSSGLTHPLWCLVVVSPTPSDIGLWSHPPLLMPGCALTPPSDAGLCSHSPLWCRIVLSPPPPCSDARLCSCLLPLMLSCALTTPTYYYYRHLCIETKNFNTIIQIDAYNTSLLTWEYKWTHAHYMEMKLARSLTFPPPPFWVLIVGLRWIEISSSTSNCLPRS